MNQTQLETLTKSMNTGTEIEAQVMSAKQHPAAGTDGLFLNYDGLTVFIPRAEVELSPYKKGFGHFVGSRIKFIVTHIDQETGEITGSRRLVKAKQRIALAELHQANPEAVYKAEITYISEFGAYLSINGCQAILRNRYFSSDHTSIGEVYKKGDKIDVVIQEIPTTGRIELACNELYTNPNPASISEFTSGSVHFGRVHTLKAWGCYIRIAPGLDALAPIPEYSELPIEQGTTVVVRLTVVDEAEGRLRGRILRVLGPDAQDCLD